MIRLRAGLVALVMVLVAACGDDGTLTDPAATTSATAGTGMGTVDTSPAAPVDETTGPDGSTSASAGVGCAPESLPTVSPGTLTVATSEPAYEPWMVDNDPTNGKGYESAVAYAVAEELGYTKEQVSWVRVPFEAAIAPTPKNFDFAINQVSITEERRQAVDFSSGYYDVTQAVVTVEGSPIADATTVADLRDARLGAMLGTTSLDAITDVVEPSGQPSIFDDNALAVSALQNGTIDGLVLDTPSAFYAAAAQLENGKVVGQLPAAGSDTEQFGLVLDKDSPLTDCVSEAVDALRGDGTLDELVDRYISGAGAPELT